MPAVAITDHGNVFGAIEFFKMARSQGLKPILGCEVYVAPKSRLEKKAVNGDEWRKLPFTFLVKDEKGYRHLCQLITSAYLEGFYYRPRIDIHLQHTGACLSRPSVRDRRFRPEDAGRRAYTTPSVSPRFWRRKFCTETRTTALIRKNPAIGVE